MRRLALSFALVAATGLSACQMGDRAELASNAPRGVEGMWNSSGGPVAYSASFTNGQFRSVEQGTGAVLAQGTYSDLGPGQVNIVYRSTTRDTEIAANCNQVDVNRLACATSGGSRFELLRA